MVLCHHAKASFTLFSFPYIFQCIKYLKQCHHSLRMNIPVNSSPLVLSVLVFLKLWGVLNSVTEKSLGNKRQAHRTMRMKGQCAFLAEYIKWNQIFSFYITWFEVSEPDSCFLKHAVPLLRGEQAESKPKTGCSNGQWSLTLSKRNDGDVGMDAANWAKRSANEHVGDSAGLLSLGALWERIWEDSP